MGKLLKMLRANFTLYDDAIPPLPEPCILASCRSSGLTRSIWRQESPKSISQDGPQEEQISQQHAK